MRRPRTEIPRTKAPGTKQGPHQPMTANFASASFTWAGSEASNVWKSLRMVVLSPINFPEYVEVRYLPRRMAPERRCATRIPTPHRPRPPGVPTSGSAPRRHLRRGGVYQPLVRLRSKGPGRSEFPPGLTTPGSKEKDENCFARPLLPAAAESTRSRSANADKLPDSACTPGARPSPGRSTASPWAGAVRHHAQVFTGVRPQKSEGLAPGGTTPAARQGGASRSDRPTEPDRARSVSA